MSENKEGTSVSHFFSIVKKLGEQVDKDFKFYPETSVYISTDIKFPCITYSIYNKKSWEEYSGNKPRWKEEKVDFNKEDRRIVKYSQMFITIVEFGVWGKSYNSVTEYREWFEKFMVRHTDTFKKEGILEILFEEQLEDQVKKIKENYFIKQPLRYHIRTERINEIVVESIKDISTKSKRISLYHDIKNKLNN